MQPGDPGDTAPPVKSRTDIIVGELLGQARDQDAREAADRLAERQATAATIATLQRTSLALIVVLLALVAGVVGVGVTGTIPGVGHIGVQRGPAPAPIEEPAPVVAPKEQP